MRSVQTIEPCLICGCKTVDTPTAHGYVPVPVPRKMFVMPATSKLAGWMFCTMVCAAVYEKLAEQEAAGDDEAMKNIHEYRGSQMMAWLVR